MNQLQLFEFQPQTLDEIVFHSGNQAGVPTLDLDMQAESIVEPFLVWGSIARTKEMFGTYAFYCDDYKFTGLWTAPDKLVKTGCAVAVEPNFSISDRMPPAVALYHVFQKRWLARYWQTRGIKIFVDVNVDPYYSKLNLLGVPRGWRAYCTRIHKGYHEQIERDYALCREHAQQEPLFVVYGGDNGFSRQTCARNGWTWIPDKRSAIKWGIYHG
jgi:hypothetical protein